VVVVVNVHLVRLELEALVVAVMVAQRVTVAREPRTQAVVAVALAQVAEAQSARAALAVLALLSFRSQQPTTAA
jgi:hypothetical protein